MAERERIAREIHDGLAQVLGYVNTKSQAIEEYLPWPDRMRRAGPVAELAGRAGDLRRRPGGDPRPPKPVVPGVGLTARSRSTPSASRRPPRSWSTVDASADARRLRPRAGGRGPGLPDRPGGAHQRPQALGARRADIVFGGRGRTARRRIADNGHGLGPARSDADRLRYGQRASGERADSIGATIDWTNPTSRWLSRVTLDVAAKEARPWSRPASF